MGKRESSGGPKWILIATGVVGLIAGVMALVVRYYEIQKTSAEAAQAKLAADRTRAEMEQGKEKGIAPQQNKPDTTKQQTDGKNPSSPKDFQPRSSTTTTVDVAHGKVEVTAKAIAEKRVIITIIGRNFGNDLRPLNEWLGNNGDIFKRKLMELGMGLGNWNLVNNPGVFTVRDGVASLELTWEQQ